MLEIGIQFQTRDAPVERGMAERNASTFGCSYRERESRKHPYEKYCTGSWRGVLVFSSTVCPEVKLCSRDLPPEIRDEERRP